MWDVEVTDQFEDWWDNELDADEQHDLAQRVRLLEENGPNVRRPVVGEIKGSKYDPQMKELICDTGGKALRVLFMFDPRRTAILLLGGDKSGEWNEWYRKAIPEADCLYDDHLAEIAQDDPTT